MPTGMNNYSELNSILFCNVNNRDFLSALLIKYGLEFKSQCWGMRGIGRQIIFTWCGYDVISSLFLWHSFNSVKGTNAILWTCLGLSLIVSLTVFVLMFLLRKMSSEPLKDEFKNTGWFDGWSLKSVSKRWLWWISVPFLFSCWVSHPVRALLSMLGDRLNELLEEASFLFDFYTFFADVLQCQPSPTFFLITLLKYWGFLGKHPSLWQS